MSFYGLPPAVEVPEMTVVRWSVQRVGEDDHVVGLAVSDGEGRASTAIQSFDRATATATTSSGRRYRLQGPPGQHPDADYTWNLWCRVNGVKACTDVSDEYAQRILDARGSFEENAGTEPA